MHPTNPPGGNPQSAFADPISLTQNITQCDCNAVAGRHPFNSTTCSKYNDLEFDWSRLQRATYQEIFSSIYRSNLNNKFAKLSNAPLFCGRAHAIPIFPFLAMHQLPLLEDPQQISRELTAHQYTIASGASALTALASLFPLFNEYNMFFRVMNLVNKQQIRTRAFCYNPTSQNMPEADFASFQQAKDTRVLTSPHSVNTQHKFTRQFTKNSPALTLYVYYTTLGIETWLKKLSRLSPLEVFMTLNGGLHRNPSLRLQDISGMVAHGAQSGNPPSYHTRSALFYSMDYLYKLTIMLLFLKHCNQQKPMGFLNALTEKQENFLEHLIQIQRHLVDGFQSYYEQCDLRGREPNQDNYLNSLTQAKKLKGV